MNHRITIDVFEISTTFNPAKMHWFLSEIRASGSGQSQAGEFRYGNSIIKDRKQMVGAKVTVTGPT
jgi:hypothetical protein